MRRQHDVRPYRSAIALAALVILAAGCASQAIPARPAAHSEVQRQEAAFLASLGVRDLEQTVRHFADDAVLHVANMPPEGGREAIRRFYGNVFRFLEESESVPEMMRLSESGDMAYSTGRVRNTFAGEQGPQEYAGKYVIVWEKREDDWLVAIYSISNNHQEARR
jgi:ketosteroid isomerase-like protein